MAERCWLLGLLALGSVTPATAAQQPNPPLWPPSIHVFGPQDSSASIEAVVKAAYTLNGGPSPSDHGQFSSARYAFLFKPGTYSVDVPVGYYTQVVGLGHQPGDVIFDGDRGVFSEEGDKKDIGGALSTFWRGAENFETRSSMLWAVSQAAPLRRAIVDKDLMLSQYVEGVGMGYSSGGFLGNVQIHGIVHAGSQQQFCTRNAQVLGGWQDGVWNMAFIGSTGVPSRQCGRGDAGAFPVSEVQQTPIIAEKPYISMDLSGKYFLNVPRMQKQTTGVDFTSGDQIDFVNVFVAKATDSAAIINRHLLQGLHVVLTPGIYHLESALRVQFANQVLLGLGFATLVPTQGTPAVIVGNVPGVRIAGVLLQAGSGGMSPSLLQWGDGSFVGDPSNPGFLHDVFARVGGPTDPSVAETSAQLMIHIASGHVIGDNLWLWRADHDVTGLVRNGQNPCSHGLVVTGDHVTIYGLAVEHTLEDLVQWSGQNGATYFFQSELPYDVTEDFGTRGYVGYRVNDTVANHRAVGAGVYHFFRDHPVVVNSGIACPPWLENSFISPLSVYLTGKGKMMHVINERGGMTGQGVDQVQWSCEKGPEVAVPTNVVAFASSPEHVAVIGGLATMDGPYSGITDADAQEDAALSSMPWWLTVFVLQSLMMCGMGGYIWRLYSTSVADEENTVSQTPTFGAWPRNRSAQRADGSTDGTLVGKLTYGLRSCCDILWTICRPMKQKGDAGGSAPEISATFARAPRTSTPGGLTARPSTPGGGAHLGFRGISPGMTGVSPVAVARSLLSRSPADARTLTPPAFGTQANKSPGPGYHENTMHSWKSSEV